MNEHNARPTKSSALRSMQALELLAALPGGLTAKELAKKMAIDRTAGYRALETLRQAGFAVKDGRPARYKTSQRLLRLTKSLIDSQLMQERALDCLQQAAKKTGYLFNISRLEGKSTVVVAQSQLRNFPPTSLSVGSAFPTHCSASGRSILAFNPRNLASDIIQHGLSKETKHTITDDVVFLAELDKIQDQGFALCDRECQPTVVTIAVPIVTASKPINSSVSVSLTASDETMQELLDYVPLLKEIAKFIADQKEQLYTRLDVDYSGI